MTMTMMTTKKMKNIVNMYSGIHGPPVQKLFDIVKFVDINIFMGK